MRPAMRDVRMAVGHEAIYASTSTAPPTRCSTGPGEATATWSGGSRGPAARSRAGGRADLIAAPRLIELCFQTAGVFELGTDRAGWRCPPTSTGSSASPARTHRARCWPSSIRARTATAVDAGVVDEEGHVSVRLEGYRTIELPGALAAEALEPIRAAMS